MIESDFNHKSHKTLLNFYLIFFKNTMKKLILILIGASLLTSCTVSKPTNETEKGFFFKTKHKKNSEK